MDMIFCCAQFAGFSFASAWVELYKQTYMLFCAMEEEFRHHFRHSNMSELVDGLRDEVVASITCNESCGISLVHALLHNKQQRWRHSS